MARRPALTMLLLTLSTCSLVAAGETGPGTNPLAKFGVDEILFAARISGTDHYYVNFGYYVTNPAQKGYRDGGRLCRLDLRSGQLTALLDDPQGGVRDPQMHYDGQKILFSYRKGGQPYYHLHEINTDGSGLRQLTDGPWDDIEPTYLPDGNLIFCSSRCERWVACWFTPVAILYHCDGDGRSIRPLSSNIVHENTPAVLPDGRVLYTRWEYVDRSRVSYHHLWTINPDGTGQMVYYGNQHGGTVMIDAKPIPGTNRVVASFSPGHGMDEHQGQITMVDPNAGPDARPYARPLTRAANFHDPYPLSPDAFLVASGRQILLLDGQGATEVLYELPASFGAMQAHEPIPLRPRPRERVIPSRIRLAETTGRLILVNVYNGRNMRGVQPGEIRWLLVLEQLAKPVNFSGEMEPITIGGSFTLKRILGLIPVEPDGSAYFEVPALRSLFFVALDANFLSVKRMQSFVTVQPGETTSCVGCHEYRAKTPPIAAASGPLVATPSAGILAIRRPPSRIQPIEDIPDLIDFPRDVQPVLDRHCVACHKADRPDGGITLAGDRGPWYSHAYATLLTAKGLVAHGRDSVGNLPPRTIGSSASRLMKLIDGSHYNAKLSDHEQRLIRLWIETGAPYPATYASLGSGMVNVPIPKEDLFSRCGGCHPGEARQRSVRFRTYNDLLYNLTQPDKSLLLLAPLSAKAGGYGLCKPRPEPAKAQPKAPQTVETELADILKENQPPKPAATEVFADTTDPHYQKLLASILRAQQDLEKAKRFDMPGFRPNPHYIREMKRCGFLPATLGPADPIDVYATDEAYWRSFWYKPPAQ